ncbi:MAG: 30S ribosomal protein S20 [Candidatus Berkelbacteria bacterium]|nr:30S ribosomal protein S20 [Candidatus Berkelbacteria bacterium]
MPIIKSAKKALAVSIKKNADNDITRAKVKNAVKGLKMAVRNQENNVPELLSAAFRELDIAAKKNVIHKNKASRLKSRLAKATTRIEATPKKKTRKKTAKK